MFNRADLSGFEQAIKNYCDKMGYEDIDLSTEELFQLFTYVGSTVVTPEARDALAMQDLHFEIKRGLARFNGLRLLSLGSPKGYKQFIEAQNKDACLSFDQYMDLAFEYSQLPNDLLRCLRASCFLTINDGIKTRFNKLNITDYPADSEAFLTWLVPKLKSNPQLLPIARPFSEAQFDILQKMYWPNTHFRHMLYTEGGNGMTSSLAEGIKAGKFTDEDLKAWRWRWLTNLFGFQADRGCKYFDAEVFALTKSVMDSLKMIFVNQDTQFLEGYLLKRAQDAGFDQNETLDESEQKFLGHLAAYFNQINILSTERGECIIEGYEAYRDTFGDEGGLAVSYEIHRQNEGVKTPTYVPAVLNSAFVALKDRFGYSESESIKLACQFMCQVLSFIYNEQLQHVDGYNFGSPVSCMKLAKVDALVVTLNRWLQSDAKELWLFLSEGNELREMAEHQLEDAALMMPEQDEPRLMTRPSRR